MFSSAYTTRTRLHVDGVCTSLHSKRDYMAVRDGARARLGRSNGAVYGRGLEPRLNISRERRIFYAFSLE